MIYCLIYVKLPHLWSKTQKTHKIGHISVLDFAVRFTKCVITLAFFQIQWKSKFFHYVTYTNGIFDFDLAKNLAAKFQNFPEKF